MQLMGALIDKERRHQFFADDLTIEGDAEFAQQVINLFDQVSIDWEEHASRIIGDVPAYQLSKLVSGVRGWLKKTSSNLKQDASDYLHEEAEWFPTREELQEFFSDIDNIRMDTDRLEARIAHVKSQLDKEGKQ
jgi:ubiquinone biosynthesis protein UbiJ